MARKNKKLSVVDKWNAYFQNGDLEDWQRLCRDLGLADNLPSKTKCRKVSPPLSHLLPVMSPGKPADTPASRP